MQNSSQQVECTIPILPVDDLDAGLSFYMETLGFSLDWRGDSIASVSRDGCCIMLSDNLASAPPVWVWIGLESDLLFQHYRERGVKIRQEPANWSWAYEMKFEDPFGNVLWLGTEPREDLPKRDSG
jgi:uncharacterized glyoxalase superfamily protein PhnB